MTTPDMLTKTATTLAIFKESSPSITPTKRVNNPDVEDRTVVLATLVCSSAAFDRYCRKKRDTNKLKQLSFSSKAVSLSPLFPSGSPGRVLLGEGNKL